MRILTIIVACFLVIMIALPGAAPELPFVWRLLAFHLSIPTAFALLILVWHLCWQPKAADAPKQVSKKPTGELKKRSLARRQTAVIALLFIWGLCYLALIFWRGDPDEWGVFLPLFAWPVALILFPTIILIKHLARQLGPTLTAVCITLALLPFLAVTLVVTLVGLFLIPIWVLVLFFLAGLMLLDAKRRQQAD